jgi:hypothetical protein
VTGFDIAGIDQVWHAVVEMALTIDKKGLQLSVPAAALSDASEVASTFKLRYLFADWPTPTVYNSQSFLGTNGQLPTPPFTMDVQ